MPKQQVEWQEFEPAVLDRAQAERRPILLLITVAWCAHCRELLRTTFGHPEIADLVHEAFVPVHADAERRPDINERYGAGGWPTIAFLTPGGELIAHERYLSAEELAPLLRRVQASFAARGDEIEQGIRELWSHKGATRDAAAGKLSMAIVETVGDAIYEKFDHRLGGWGERAKFPHTEAIDFALVQVAKRNDERMKEVVTVTLDRMIEGAIHDQVDGGFFRFSKTPDWRSPNFEKVLDANVQRMRCYLEAWQLLHNEAYRRAAEGVVRWMLAFMRDEETGAFFGSQDADAAYYALAAEERRRATPPRVDRTLYTHANAMAVSNLLKASVVLDRGDLRDCAMQVLHFLRENLTDQDGNVYHYWDGTYHLPGLLSDQAYLVRALIDASQLTGDADLLLPAERIAGNVIRSQRAPAGGFYDIMADQSYRGSMRRRNRSILENAVMAEALVRLSYLSRRGELYEEAIRALESFTGDYKEYGYYVAGYGRAVDLIFYPPLIVTIVGDRSSDAADALRRAALQEYVPSRIVQMLDPAHDPILIERSGYPVKDRPTVYLCVGRTTKATVQTPDALLAKMNEIERERRERA